MIESHFAVAPNCVFLCWSGRACVSQKLFSGTLSSLWCCCCVKLPALQASELPFSQVVCPSYLIGFLKFSSSSTLTPKPAPVLIESGAPFREFWSAFPSVWHEHFDIFQWLSANGQGLLLTGVGGALIWYWCCWLDAAPGHLLHLQSSVTASTQSQGTPQQSEWGKSCCAYEN